MVFVSISRRERRNGGGWSRGKDPIRSLCCTSSQYRIDGQCRYWRWHVLKHTPFIGAHVSVSMSVFRRPFLPTCLPRRDIRVVLPRCTVCRANRAHRKKFWPVETRNFDEFLFFLFFFFRFSIPIRAIFDRFSIGPTSTFNTVIF